MRPKTLAQGPPPLTTAAADAALDAMNFSKTMTSLTISQMRAINRS